MGQTSEQSPTGSRKILLVDDEPNILTALRRLLRRESYEVVTESDAPTALKLLETQDFDVIVSDQRMPSMTGVEFLRKAKQLRPHSMRIVLSGYTDLDSVTAAINEGAIYKFLTKPWDDEQLRRHIADALRHKHMEDENLRMSAELKRINERQTALNTQLAEFIHQQQANIFRDESVLTTLRDILRLIPLPIVGCDSESTIVFCNEAAEQLFGAGASAPPLLGSDLSTVWPGAPDDPPPWHRGGVCLSNERYAVDCKPLSVHQPEKGTLYLFLKE